MGAAGSGFSGHNTGPAGVVTGQGSQFSSNSQPGKALLWEWELMALAAGCKGCQVVLAVSVM